jgi:uroporphyrinogen III methyltransferase / synthase
LIAKKALEGHTVTRLKGGDPFIFGRGGEEAEVLVQKKVPFEIVPGVTSAIAAPAYAGIPLTHRQMTSTLAFVTGHEDPTKESSSIDWASLSKAVGTLVFLMGVKNLSNIVDKLLVNGKPPETPVALVRWGTTPKQVTVSGTLENIVARVQEKKLKAPAIIVIGEVVNLRNSLAWFEKRPLLGKTIVVTRAREQASDLVGQLRTLGANCLECPTIKIKPPEDSTPLENAINKITDYQWIVFTSVNGVKFFFERLSALQKDARALGHLRTAAIGPATAQKLREYGLTSDIVPESYRAESVVTAFSKESIEGIRILLPRAKEARPILPVELNKLGAHVDEIIAYQTEQDHKNVDKLMAALEAKKVDMVTFTSSSTVKNFKALFPADSFQDSIAGVTVASIGPITADTLHELGMEVNLVADTYTIPGLCDAILRYYASA